MYSIGIFVAQKSLERIMTIDEEMRQECNITYLQYTSTRHLLKLYKENAEKFDGILFSGPYPYDTVQKNMTLDPKKPHFYFDIFDRDYYKLFLSIAVKYPGIQFSKIYFDNNGVPCDLDSIFPPDQMPCFDSSVTDGIYHSSINELYDISFQHYLSIWSEKKYDLIVTRFSNLIPMMRDLNITCEHLAPSRRSMLDIFHQLQIQLSENRAGDSSVCYGLVRPLTPLSHEEENHLKTVLNECSQNLGINFMIRRTEDYFELTTTNAVFRNISNNFSSCPVKEYLMNHFQVPVAVGWGNSNDVAVAYRNAERALKESGYQAPEHLSFLVTENNIIVGPLSSARRLAYTDMPTNRIDYLRKKTGLSSLTLHRVISVIQQKNTNSISAEELAFFLNVTVRSASRILSKLEASGAAIVAQQRQLNLRGRPTKIYTINFGLI